MKLTIHPIIVALFISLAGAPIAGAEELRGARALLDAVATQAPKPATPNNQPLSEHARIRRDLTNFTARLVGLQPAEASREWLTLVDRVATTPAPQESDPDRDLEEPVDSKELLRALPPPAAWDDLARQILERPAPEAIAATREFGLRMLARALQGNPAAVSEELVKLETLLATSKRHEALQLVPRALVLRQALLALSDDSKPIRASIERELSEIERDTEFRSRMLVLPDLVGILGEVESAPLVRRAVASRAPDLEIEGTATRTLARKLALEGIEELRVPRWNLVDSLDALELFEALDKKFGRQNSEPAPGNAPTIEQLEDRIEYGDFERERALVNYVFGLIDRGRTAEAAKVMRSMDESAIESIEIEEQFLARSGFISRLDDFLYELLSKSPELNWWALYFDAAVRSGHTARMVVLARAAATRPELSAASRSAIRGNLYRALLAADEVEEGVKELRALLGRPSNASTRSSRGKNRNALPFNPHAPKLVQLGILLNRPEWIAEGLAAVDPGGDGSQTAALSEMGFTDLGFLEELLEAGLYAHVEKLLGSQLQAFTQSQDRSVAWLREMGKGAPALNRLAWLYHRAHRPSDVLLLLEQSPDWGMRDLAGIFAREDFDLSVGSRQRRGNAKHAVAIPAAAALIEAHREPEARPIVDALLDAYPANDAAYELLVRLAGQEAIARLDALFSRDRFEERPLIWKAMVLLKAGKSEEAEKAARQAIAIDPSDGDQGPGDRMRAYSVLADVRAARGDSKEAEVLRRIVQAVRLSERADAFERAGLLRRAVKMYEESLTQFADAYCIQARLAVQLASLGLHDAAAAHYQKAFELMPDSFGRLESHCFGCEGAFKETQAQTVAERVFTKLAAKNPDKPQIHYLLGYLRQQQGRAPEALPHFRRAVQLDSDYLNAWTRLQEISEHVHIPVVERDSIALNTLRLDPLHRHAVPDLRAVRDLRKLWAVSEATLAVAVKRPTALLPLPASRERLEANERDAAKRSAALRFNRPMAEKADRSSKTPADVLLKNQLVSAIADLMDVNEHLNAEE